MKIKFLPSGKELDINPEKSVMEMAHENGIFIKSICNGLPSCAECRIKIVEGDHNILPPSGKEMSLIGTAHHLDQRRLSCQMHCYGNVVVDLTEQESKSEETGQRRPQGALKKDESEVSRAVMGNMIDED